MGCGPAIVRSTHSIAARRLRARRQEAEAHAALLLAIGDQAGGPGIGLREPGPEDAVGHQAQQDGVNFTDDGASVTELDAVGGFTPPKVSDPTPAMPSRAAMATLVGSVASMMRVECLDD